MTAKSPSNPTAALVLIGNELLSGRTRDINLNCLAPKLSKAGIPLREVRIVPDVETEIVAAVNACRKRYDHLFTSGGIGPTHDDITTAAIAKAFSVPVQRHPEAEALLRAHYSEDEINEARLKMADIPAGGMLIPNPVSSAPGFILENTYVMAGVPVIFDAMTTWMIHRLQPGMPCLSHTIAINRSEGTVAAELSAIQSHYPGAEIGSYPFFRQGVLGTSLVVRGTDKPLIDKIVGELRQLAGKANAAIIIDQSGEVG